MVVVVVLLLLLLVVLVLVAVLVLLVLLLQLVLIVVGIWWHWQYVRYGVVQSLVCLQLVLALGKGTERVVEGALVNPASAVFDTDLQLGR